MRRRLLALWVILALCQPQPSAQSRLRFVIFHEPVLGVTFVTDTFTDTAGDNLATQHTGEVGATWVPVTGGGGGNWLITDAGRVRPASAGTAHDTRASGVPTTAEYDVDADFRVFTHAGDFSDTPRLWGRLLATEQTGYFVYNSGGTWILYQMEAGMATGYLGEFASPLVDGTTYHVKLAIRDASKKVYLDGVLIITSFTNVLTTKGYVGIGTGYYPTAATNSTGVHLDNVIATEATGGGVDPPDDCEGCVRIETTDTAQTVIAANPAGSTFLFAAGVHRRNSISPRSGDTYYGETGAILSGAILLHTAADATLGSFTTSGSYWRIGGQTQVGGARNGECQTLARDYDADYNGCDYPEELFIDDVRLLHVVTLAEMGPNEWFFDYAADFIYIGNTPAGHKVETSTTQTAFSPTGDNVTIDGLTIQMYANQPQHGPIEGEGRSGWTIQNCTIQLNHGGALRTDDGMLVSNNYIAYNGQIGPVGVGTDVIIENNEIAHNNDAHYNQGWEGGGSKLVSTVNLIVRGNYSHHNHGPGLWTDIDNIYVTYEDNTVDDNDREGIFHEISYDAIIRNNTVRRNGFEERNYAYGAGIHVASSPNVEIYGNTVQDNADGILGMMQARGTGAYGLHETTNLYVHNNTIRQQPGPAQTWAGGLVQDVGDLTYFTGKNNRFVANTWILQGSTNFFSWMNGDGQSYAVFQGSPNNQDAGGSATVY